MSKKWSAEQWGAKPLPNHPGCFLRFLGTGYHSQYRLWAGPAEAVTYVGTYRTLHKLYAAAAEASAEQAA